MEEKVVNTITELLDVMSIENDRIGDFESIKWLIDSSDDLVLELGSGQIVRLVNHK